MRLALGASATGCLLAAIALTLRDAGLLTAAGHWAGQWWPAFLPAAGLAILFRSVKPGPHIAVSIGLMGGGSLAFVITHRVVSDHIWVFVATGGLVAVGIMTARLAVNYRTRDAEKSKRVFILLRAAEITLRSSDLDHVRVFLVCGRLELNLADAVLPKHRRDSPVMVDASVYIGKIHVIVQPGVELIDHKAFVMRFNRPLVFGILTEEQIRKALIVVSSLAFFGDVEIKEARGVAANVRGG